MRNQNQSLLTKGHITVALALVSIILAQNSWAVDSLSPLTSRPIMSGGTVAGLSSLSSSQPVKKMRKNAANSLQNSLNDESAAIVERQSSLFSLRRDHTHPDSSATLRKLKFRALEREANLGKLTQEEYLFRYNEISAGYGVFRQR